MRRTVLTAAIALPRAVLESLIDEDLRWIEAEVSKLVQAEFEKLERLIISSTNSPSSSRTP